MADESVINGEFSDDQNVEISGDEASAKISGLTVKVADLERENAKTVQENEGYKQQLEQLKASIKELNSEIVELKKEIDKAESESKALGAVAARAAELESEVSRLQHDLVSAMSDLQESTTELTSLKKDFERVKEKEKEKDVQLEAIVKERDLLLVKVEEMESEESSLRGELVGKEKEISGLKKSNEDLKVAVESSKGSEKSNNDLEIEIEKLKLEISILQSSLKEKENVISGFEMKEEATYGGLSGEGEKSVKQTEWKIVGGSVVAAVVFMGLVCYVRARRY
ncbi:Peroxisomal and mitochondrial division factor 2 [Striga hermonthica]|uniref:Peroxisomal and mitochondrial division factor 2 n=1 Tax=Striga hermonthica TaxID=68872 RepID=A0A9N7R2X2_STRHE|nr:Peroxisomal and mitochondrial division factor 2 [Striga hermonthica]